MSRLLDGIVVRIARSRGYTVSRTPGRLSTEQDHELVEAEREARSLAERLRRVRLYEVMRANMQRGPKDGSE